MTEVQIWALLGVGRASNLSRKLGISRQAVSSNSFKFDDNVYVAMNQIEQSEMRLERCVRNNILCAAKATTHENDSVRKKAYFALVVWSEIYGRFKNV